MIYIDVCDHYSKVLDGYRKRNLGICDQNIFQQHLQNEPKPVVLCNC
jgi:hypothetical protein